MNAPGSDDGKSQAHSLCRLLARHTPSKNAGRRPLYGPGNRFATLSGFPLSIPNQSMMRVFAVAHVISNLLALFRFGSGESGLDHLSHNL